MSTSENKFQFFRGMRDAIPIAIGYCAVSFTLGIKAESIGFSFLQMILISINVTAPGEAAVLALLGAGTTYLELAFTEVVINVRYLLMSCALSQKLRSSTPVYHRFLMSFGITDEIFGISVSVKGRLSPFYTYGALAICMLSWTCGALLGRGLGDVLPPRLSSALGVALYIMLLCVVLPPARKKPLLGGIVAVSMLASFGFYELSKLPAFSWLTEGFRIIILTVIIATAAAFLFPVKEDPDEDDEEDGADKSKENPQQTSLETEQKEVRNA